MVVAGRGRQVEAQTVLGQHTDPKHFSGPNVEFGFMERASHLVSRDLSSGRPVLVLWCVANDVAGRERRETVIPERVGDIGPSCVEGFADSHQSIGSE